MDLHNNSSMQCRLDIAFVGFGTLGRQIQSMLANSHGSGRNVYFDDRLSMDHYPDAYPLDNYANSEFRNFRYYICLGYKHLVRKNRIIAELSDADRLLPEFIHKTSFVNPSARVGLASIVYPLCNLDMEVGIGRGVVLHNSVTISHHSVIHDSCYIAPGVIVCGFVEVGENTFIGAGSVISNEVKIGKNVVVGAGTVVTRDIPDGRSAIGNPMKILTKNIVLK